MEAVEVIVEELEDETLAAGTMTRPGCLASESIAN